jgi:hypothetical protein
MCANKQINFIDKAHHWLVSDLYITPNGREIYRVYLKLRLSKKKPI